MPELPETETIARDLHESVAGAVVARVTVHREDVLRETTPEHLAKAVKGVRIARVWRRAKLVVLDLNRTSKVQATDQTAIGHIVVQPRFTGAMLIDDGTLPADRLKYLTITFDLDDSRALHYRDVRRLGTVSLMSPARFVEYTKKLGPEPLDDSLSNTDFSGLVRASRRPVKTLLMDQSRLAGVGNIYANEALWRAGIDPSRMAASLTDVEAGKLLAELRSVLTASIAARGTSFRDYRDARGQRGSFVDQLCVYGRGGEPCLTCGRRLIDTPAIDKRTTVFCSHCQR
ncbi:MAG: bifunctional DNA-formamidopyrimidine glycosylase/DNA-(apurinic or apyrimidinic site) lyase [Gemmatimonas sp.]